MISNLVDNITSLLNKFWLGNNCRVNSKIKEGESDVAVEVVDLFDITRFTTELSLFKKFLLILYAPIGIILVLLRLLTLIIWISIFLILIATKSYTVSSKKMFCGGVCFISGLLPRFINEHHINMTPAPRFIVTNHSYTFEFLPFISKYWCFMTGRQAVTEHWAMSLVEKLVDGITVDDFTTKYSEITKSELPIFMCPEGATTNGRVGILKYNPLIFFYGETVLPIATKIKRPLPIACCRLHLALVIDFLWLLYVPWTICEYTLLAPQKIQEGELPDEFAKRVQIMTSESLGIIATDYTVDDKNQLRHKDKDIPSI